jgi:hypothetical protein
MPPSATPPKAVYLGLHSPLRHHRSAGPVLVASYALSVTFLVLDAGDSEAVDVVRPIALVLTPD